MIDYIIEEIDLTGENLQQIIGLLNTTFGTEISAEKLHANTATLEEPKTLYIAAKCGSEIIGFNAFISHRLLLNGQRLTAYQSCWTATSEAHRGKRIFQNLIGAGREILRSRGAAFIFGYPNPNSRPIFVEKLHFREIPCLKWRMPLLPGLRRFWINQVPIVHRANAILQDEQHIISLKSAEHGKLLKTANFNESSIWGVERRRLRYGVPFKFFEIGGLDLRNASDLQPLLRAASRLVPASATLQFVTNSGNTYNEHFRRLATILPPLIVDDLELDTREVNFNLFGGIRDYY